MHSEGVTPIYRFIMIDYKGRAIIATAIRRLETGRIKWSDFDLKLDLNLNY